MMVQDLYMTSKDGEITREYIGKKISSCGISKGDAVMASCRLPFLGTLAGNKTVEDMSKLIIEEILEAVGKDGTLAVPAYSYSFCRKEEFDPGSTPSTLGTFFEAFRKSEGVIRTHDPIFSVCIKGAQAGYLSGGASDNCFGPGSFFDRFHSLKGSKYLLIGLNYHYITSIHYIEQTNKVSYRYIKNFAGTVVMPGNSRVQRLQKYFVRNLDQFYDFRPLFAHLERIRAGATVPFGNSTMRTITDKLFFDTVSKLLKEDERYLLLSGEKNRMTKSEGIS